MPEGDTILSLAGRLRPVFEQGGRACRRCGDRILVRGQWDENRMTYWCPTCQR